MRGVYEALDVREYKVIGKTEYSKSYGCSGSGGVYVPQHLRVIVIARDDHSKKRVRFEFLEAYKYEFLDKTHYCGYTGDWNLIIPGDYFTIEETNTFDNVRIISNL